MKKRILWVSRHSVKDFQVRELKRVFGDETTVHTCPIDASSAQAIEAVYRQGGYDDLVVVAPYSVLDHLCRLGLRPLWSVNPQVEATDSWDFQHGGRFYKFERFARVVKLELVLEDLE